MGQKLVTTAYIDNNKDATQSEPIKETSTPEVSAPKPPSPHNPHHAHMMMNVNMNDIPSECPMHQAKAKNTQASPENTYKKQATGGCPVKHDEKNDINPNNMVCLLELKLKFLFLTSILILRCQLLIKCLPQINRFLYPYSV